MLTPLSDTSQHFKPYRRPAATIPKVFSFSPQIFAMIMWLQIWKAALLLKWQVIEWVCSKGLNKDVSSRPAPFPPAKDNNKCFLPENRVQFSANILLKEYIS